MGTFQVLCVDYDAPYVYQKDGEPSGMIVSILNDFAETAGLSLNYTFCADRSAAAAKRYRSTPAGRWPTSPIRTMTAPRPSSARCRTSKTAR